jgi:hypothetical protein
MCTFPTYHVFNDSIIISKYYYLYLYKKNILLHNQAWVKKNDFKDLSYFDKLTPKHIKEFF